MLLSNSKYEYEITLQIHEVVGNSLTLMQPISESHYRNKSKMNFELAYLHLTWNWIIAKPVKNFLNAYNVNITDSFGKII